MILLRLSSSLLIKIQMNVQVTVCESKVFTVARLVRPHLHLVDISEKPAVDKARSPTYWQDLLRV